MNPLRPALLASMIAVASAVLACSPAEAKTTPQAFVQIETNVTASTAIKSFYTTLVETMKQGNALGFEGRYKKLDPAVRSTFNLPLMTRFAVGYTWARATPDEQNQLISAFSKFSVATYASRFTSYDGEQFVVLEEKPAPDGVMVETKLQPKQGDAVSLNYLMRKDEKGFWRIVDVFLNGSISELATRRSEFGAIVQREGIEALLNSLSEKSRQMGPT
ncbi:MAG: ABC transporter substrate-binding protein [Bdellovibrionales bacterium]